MIRQERVRADSELWQAALGRNKWKAVHHIRGDGIGTQLGSLPKTVEDGVEMRRACCLAGAKRGSRSQHSS